VVVGAGTVPGCVLVLGAGVTTPGCVLVVGVGAVPGCVPPLSA